MRDGQPYENKIIEIPNKQQMNKNEYVVREGKFRKKYATNLERYYAEGILSEDQYRAGDRLYQDAYHGGVLSQIKAIDYTAAKENPGGIKKMEMSWLRADKHKSFSDAMHSTEIGRLGRDILWHICIFDFNIKSFDENRHFASGLLRETLNELVRYYRNQR